MSSTWTRSAAGSSPKPKSRDRSPPLRQWYALLLKDSFNIVSCIIMAYTHTARLNIPTTILRMQSEGAYCIYVPVLVTILYVFMSPQLTQLLGLHPLPALVLEYRQVSGMQVYDISSGSVACIARVSPVGSFTR